MPDDDRREAAAPSAPGASITRIDLAELARMHAAGEPITMLTAYDYPTARLLDEAGVEILLVGDSVGRAELGYQSELLVTLDDMVHHTQAVVRGASRALVIADLPFLAYGTLDQALLSARRLIVDGGAQAVKLEGGTRSAQVIAALARSGVPVMGHVGFTPQSAGVRGRARVQGKTIEAARAVIADADAVQAANAFALVLELVPEQLARMITDRLQIPTIGIGAGAGCSGQVQVVSDLLGLDSWRPRHARAYADLRSVILEAVTRYRSDVRDGSFPTAKESVRMDEQVLSALFGRPDPESEWPAGAAIPLDRDL